MIFALNSPLIVESRPSILQAKEHSLQQHGFHVKDGKCYSFHRISKEVERKTSVIGANADGGRNMYV